LFTSYGCLISDAVLEAAPAGIKLLEVLSNDRYRKMAQAFTA